jgi:hypothetical protein
MMETRFSKMRMHGGVRVSVGVKPSPLIRLESREKPGGPYQLTQREATYHAKSSAGRPNWNRNIKENLL